MRQHQNAAELQKCRKRLEPALAKQPFSVTAPHPPLSSFTLLQHCSPSSLVSPKYNPSFVASIQPAEQAGILTETCAGDKGQVRLLVLKGQKQSGAGGCLTFRIYYISCTVTSASYSPHGLGEMLCVCISYLTAEPRDVWRLDAPCFMCRCPGFNPAGAASNPQHSTWAPRVALRCFAGGCWWDALPQPCPEPPPLPLKGAPCFALPRAVSPHGEQPRQGIVPKAIGAAGSREVAVLLLACSASGEACGCHTVSLGLWGRLP